MDSRIVAKSNGVRRTEGIGSLTTVRRGIWMDPTIRLRCWHGCSHYREEEASVVVVDGVAGMLRRAVFRLKCLRCNDWMP